MSIISLYQELLLINKRPIVQPPKQARDRNRLVTEKDKKIPLKTFEKILNLNQKRNVT